MAKLEEAKDCELPAGLSSDETSRYMLQYAHPDADPAAIEAGVAVLRESTLAQIKGGELTMESIYEAAKRLEDIFPTPALDD